MAKSQPDPLAGTVATEAAIPVEEMALRLGLAAVFGVAVAAVYFLTQRRKRAEAASFVSTLVLLSILLAMVSMVIGGNIARAFSLVGALAIVRFRTVVEDTRDTAFVIFAVVTGMAAGAGAWEVAAVGIPLVGFTAWALRAWGGNGSVPATATIPPGRLVVRVGIGTDPNSTLAEVFGKYTAECRLVAIATARQGAALGLTYAVRLREGITALALTSELNRIEGVQGVEWGEGKEE